jgi:hypothetical protein
MDVAAEEFLSTLSAIVYSISCQWETKMINTNKWDKSYSRQNIYESCAEVLVDLAIDKIAERIGERP